jgi:hypothetical protein
MLMPMPKPTRSYLATGICSVLGLCLLQSFAVGAQNQGMVNTWTGQDLSQLSGLDKFDLTVSGWADMGYTFNPAKPADRSNGPVQFNNRANEFNLYQLGLAIEKAVDKNLKEWQMGGRFEFMFGTDTPNTQATGHWDSHLISSADLRNYDLAFPQAYLEVLWPFGNGMTTKVGHFYSIIGYESVAAPNNQFVSHSYSMKSSPFTMSGLLNSYAVNDWLTIQAGAVTGPDNLDQHAGAWSFLGGLSLTNLEHSRDFTFSVLNGNVDDTQPSQLLYYYAMFHQALGKQWHFVLQHDYGHQQKVRNNHDAKWYSIVNYLSYEFNPDWTAGLRSEWFRDNDGTRFNSAPGSYYAASAMVNWKTLTWLTLRSEIRYDWASGLKPFQNQTRQDQLLIAVDMVLRF